MTDNPLPSPQAASPPQTPGALTPSVNGTATAAEPTHAPPTYRELLHYYAINAGLLAGLWAVAFVVLLMLKFETRDAVGFAFVATLVGSFFTRSLIPQLADKARPASAAQPQHVDSAREIIETVVFVVVLVLLLKSYAAEAFVIPTGSMAETLWGYQKVVTCPQCDVKFPVNCSSEVDPSDGSPPVPVTGCTCPNRCPSRCGGLTHATPTSRRPQVGWIRDLGLAVRRSGAGRQVRLRPAGEAARPARRRRLPLPRRPRLLAVRPGQEARVPMNYISCPDGLPGETVGIHRGKLWVLSPEKSPEVGRHREGEERPCAAWPSCMPGVHADHDDPRSLDLFNAGEYAIVRKKPEHLPAMRRLVYDNDHQRVIC
ncbi:MAG: hypothetical protein U0797_26110 [Gemmataceae bacterium]